MKTEKMFVKTHQSKIKICARIQNFQKNKNKSLTFPKKLPEKYRGESFIPFKMLFLITIEQEVIIMHSKKHKGKLGICAGLQSFQKKQKNYL